MKVMVRNLLAYSMIISYCFDLQSNNITSEDSKAKEEMQSQLDAKASDPYPLAYFYEPTTQKAYVYADWLLWKPVTGPITWVSKQNFQTNSTQTSSLSNCTRSTLSLPYASGFRVGSGYQFAKDNLGIGARPMQIEASYERIVTSHESHAEASGVKIYQSDVIQNSQYLDSYLSLGDKSTNAKLRYFLRYNRADLKFNWPMWTGQDVIFRLGGGATFGYFDSSINQFSNLNYSTASKNQNVLINRYGDFHAKLKWKWFGGGPSLFADVNVDLAKGFGIFAGSSFSALFGERHTNAKQKYSNIINVSGFNLNKKHNYYSFQPVVQFGAGINYKHWFNSVLLYASASWEFNYWFYMNPIPSLLGESIGTVFLKNYTRSISFEGLTTRFGVAF